MSGVQLLEYTNAQLAELVPHPDRDANKYTRGKLVLVGGCADYPGAACLAACAAQRLGAGYVQAYCAPETAPILVGRHPSVVATPWDKLACAYLPQHTPAKPVAYVVGPGLDARDAQQAACALKVLRYAQAPVLVDGGALGALATGEGRQVVALRAEQGWPTVLTPHAGEAARLARAARLACPAEAGDAACGAESHDGATSDVAAHDAELAEFACALAKAYSATVVLKGPDTWIAEGDVACAMREGGPALAKAGTGDVLAGAIGGLLAQGLAPRDAAVLGAMLHARAGNAAAADLTDIAVVPEDVLAYLPHALKTL